MKNLIIALLLLVLTAKITTAQHVQVRPYYSFQNITFPNEKTFLFDSEDIYEQDFNWKSKSKFGIDITIGDQFFIQPGIGFSFTELSINNTSLKSNGNPAKIVKTDNVKLTALIIPLKVGYRFFSLEDDKILNFRVFGGVEGMNIIKVEHDEMSFLISEITKDNFFSPSISGNFGLGMDRYMITALQK